ncbi:MAG: ATPase, partial [Ideonella sp.]|nr:ATPase [Ideonella sp.]
MSPTDDPRELRLERDLPFARALVWQAMTDPDHVNRWWGPDGFT